MEKVTAFTKETLIPFGLVLLMFGGIWYMAKMDARIDHNGEETARIWSRLDDTPTRAEYKVMQEDIGEIKTDLKTLIGNR